MVLVCPQCEAKVVTISGYPLDTVVCGNCGAVIPETKTPKDFNQSESQTSDDDKEQKKKRLLGLWEFVKEDGKFIDRQESVEFAPDNTWKIILKSDNGNATTQSGTFEVTCDGVKLKDPDFPKEDVVWKIKTLTDRRVVFELDGHPPILEEYQK